MTNRRRESGFTLTELVLALAFISFLLVFLMTMIVHVTRIYNKGLSIRQINQSGRQFSEDFARTARYATPGGILQNAAAQRVCVNNVTYAWNIKDPSVNPKNEYVSGTKRITLVKVNDPGGSLCLNGSTKIPLTAKDILPQTLNVQNLAFEIGTTDNRVVTLHSVISTAGLNSPVLGADGPFDYECPAGSDGAFCAVAEYESTVYIRN